MGVVESIGGAFLSFHQGLYEKTDGRVGHGMIGVPCLLLRTTGRKSGQTRTSALVYARDGDDYLLVGSNGGSDRPPGWVHNVRADPEVEVQVRRHRMAGRARVVGPSDPDYERLWRLVNEGNHNRYAGYQKKTTRPIPVIAVHPTES
jgi:deazaflavin-dependent oxidoreductase (nitroreductase family)